MGETAGLRGWRAEVGGAYRQRPLKVSAIQWEPELGIGHGVRARPKKHKSNPDEFYVRDRFGKEARIEPGQWVLTYPDGSNAILADGTFQALYEPDVAAADGEAAATGQPSRTVEPGKAQDTLMVSGDGGATLVSGTGSQTAHPGTKGDPD